MKIKLGDFNVSFNFKTFHFYSDGGHGWCKVPYGYLYRLGILDRISEYSYWGELYAKLKTWHLPNSLTSRAWSVYD